jgi:hypothetical protein
MVNLAVSFSIRRYPSKIMISAMWEYFSFDNQIFGRGKLYYSNSIIVTNFASILIPSCWFENDFPAYFGIEITSQDFHTVFGKSMEYTFSSSSQQLSFTSSSLFSDGA